MALWKCHTVHVGYVLKRALVKTVTFYFNSVFNNNFVHFRLLSPGKHVLSYQLNYPIYKEELPSSIERSTVQDGLVVVMIMPSIAMIHHKISGPL